MQRVGRGEWNTSVNEKGRYNPRVEYGSACEGRIYELTFQLFLTKMTNNTQLRIGHDGYFYMMLSDKFVVIDVFKLNPVFFRRGPFLSKYLLMLRTPHRNR